MNCAKIAMPLYPIELFFILGMIQVTFIAWTGFQILLNSPLNSPLRSGECKKS
jgi:hypothetical protein